MKPLFRNFATATAVAAVFAVAATALLQGLHAESPRADQPGPPTMMHGAMPGHDQMQGTTRHHRMMMQMHGPHTADAVGSAPTMPGQDAFGAIGEIVRILEADPKTDWSKVNLEALRQHLIDMNDVTLKADVALKSIDGGLEIAVTGTDRTLAAIQRMLPAHAKEIDGFKGWSAKTAPLPNGILLTVTAKDAKEVEHIRGLGFVGILVTGSHHQAHHLAMAKGEFAHKH